MRALTIWEPWASLITWGLKRTENRTWATDYRGPLLIHAGKTVEEWDVLSAEQWKVLEAHWAFVPHQSSDVEDEFYELNDMLHPGNVLAIADMVGCDRDTTTIWDVTGQWHWRLDNVRPIYPVKARGKQGLWTPDAELMQRVNESRARWVADGRDAA